MPIRLVTPNAEINGYIERELEKVRESLIRDLASVGERVVNKARSLPSLPASAAGKPHQPSYIDWSTNLRSSIGYAVVVDGEVANISGFEAVKNGQEGSKAGADYARELARRYPKGIVLIVCAGMNYASYVSAKGYDVLDSAELLADELARELGLKRL